MKTEYLKMMKMIDETVEHEEVSHSLRRIPVRFMSREHEVRERIMGLAIPESAVLPCPVIYIAHYGIDEKTVGRHEALARGFAVAGNLQSLPQDNALLFDEDLYLNSACIDVLRHCPELDPEKIVIMGGSAGGYQTLMLSALHLGIAASVDFSGFVNPYFNLVSYVDAIRKINEEAFQTIPAEKRKDLNSLMDVLPMPLHMAVFPTFFSGVPGKERETCMTFAYSPAGLTACYSNPILFVHNTADSLVPISQIQRDAAIYENGISMPENLSLQLSDYTFPEEESSKTLVELLPPDSYHLKRIPAPEKKAEVQAPFDLKKRFQIVIVEDGCPEAWNGHAAAASGTVSAMDYVEAVLKQKTEDETQLSDEKLLLLLQKAAGLCPIFPLYSSEEEGIYGTSEQMIKEVYEELSLCLKFRSNEPDLLQRIRDISETHIELEAICETMIALISGKDSTRIEDRNVKKQEMDTSRF